MPHENKYCELSIKLTKDIPREEKKSGGIFFTPPKTVEICLEKVSCHVPPFLRVLEPSCGSGEFIIPMLKCFPHSSVQGIEHNPTIYQSIKDKYPNIINADFLKYIPENPSSFDLIIGNPPYYVMKKNSVDKKYDEYYDGRPNIFLLFIIKSLSLLSPNGILCFVLPNNFLNCIYYEKTRAYILKKFTIINIYEPEGSYIETQQNTIVLIVKNKKTEVLSPFATNVGSNKTIIFGTNQGIIDINNLMNNTTTLTNLGFNVYVGKTVWNENKNILTDDITQTRLIYSSDIKNNSVVVETYKNPEKKNYIKKDGNTGKVLLVNRGYGTGEYKFNFCLYESEHPYLIENHLICISGPDDGSYEKIVKSFKDERTIKFINIYFCNNTINTYELANILPIYV